MAFCSAAHVFVKTIDKAGVTFPTTKAEIMEKLGDVEVQVADDTFVKAAGIVEGLATEEYPNGAAFMCAYTARAMMAVKENMESVKKFNAK